MGFGHRVCCCDSDSVGCDCSGCASSYTLTANVTLDMELAGGAEVQQEDDWTMTFTKGTDCAYTATTVSGTVTLDPGPDEDEITSLSISGGTAYLDCYDDPYDGAVPVTLPAGLPAGPGFLLRATVVCGLQQCDLYWSQWVAWAPLFRGNLCPDVVGFQLTTPVVGDTNAFGDEVTAVSGGLSFS